jgi:hypothetical protein
MRQISRVLGHLLAVVFIAFSSFLLRSIIGVSNEEEGKKDRERMRGSKNYHGD